MTDHEHHARRAFLSRLGVGAVAAGVVAGTGIQAQSPSGGTRGWQPARHPQDDWLDQLPGGHRFVLDTTSPAGFNAALPFVNNFFTANRTAYGLNDNDLAVVIVARHDSTPFSYNDSMWAKYGASLAKRSGFTDPATGRPPVINVYRTPLEALLKRGVHLAVCDMSTRLLATNISAGGGSTADTVYAELAANMLSNAHMVPAGIVALNRAQERGYTFAHAV
jgi:intracellular sulfur oxidation DsrE/DsrF family protein